MTWRVSAAIGNIRRDPGLLTALPDKLGSKASWLRRRRGEVGSRDWCAEQAVDVAAFMHAIEPELAAEATSFHRRASEAIEELMPSGGFAATSGAKVRLLHFLTRWRRPGVVVETGVAGGASSWAVLDALRTNGRGRLFSSDLPYLFRPDAAANVGVVVPDDLRADWHLHLGTDRRNLPKILSSAETVDLFHYDSDKSFRGRAWAHGFIRERLSENAVVVFDDIEENEHFRDLVATIDRDRWRVFAEPTKFVGLILPSPV